MCSHGEPCASPRQNKKKVPLQRGRESLGKHCHNSGVLPGGLCQTT